MEAMWNNKPIEIWNIKLFVHAKFYCNLCIFYEFMLKNPPSGRTFVWEPYKKMKRLQPILSSVIHIAKY